MKSRLPRCMGARLSLAHLIRLLVHRSFLGWFVRPSFLEGCLPLSTNVVGVVDYCLFLQVSITSAHAKRLPNAMILHPLAHTSLSCAFSRSVLSVRPAHFSTNRCVQQCNGVRLFRGPSPTTRRTLTPFSCFCFVALVSCPPIGYRRGASTVVLPRWSSRGGRGACVRHLGCDHLNFCGSVCRFGVGCVRSFLVYENLFFLVDL